MTAIAISEAGSVQFPMVRHAAGIGWTPLPPEEARAKRGGTGGMLLRDELAAALRRLNPWLAPDDVRRVVETVDALPATIEGNRQALRWLRGERSWHDEAEARHRPVRLIDYDDPGANALHVSWEWTFEPAGGIGGRKGNRADVVFAVNGVPVAIVEHKTPTDANAIEKGITQLRRYEAETPGMVATSQVFNVTHLLDYWYGVTWNATRRDMARWKERPEEAYRFAVQAFFEPHDFLRTLREWVLFYVEDGETRKSILRQHQRRAIDAVVARCADPAKTRGLVWHTQGSGKTFTLLTAARLILEGRAGLRAATVILVVDRVELEGQLRDWVDRMLGEMQAQAIAIRRADSRADLQDILDADFRGLVLATIHKFEAIRKDSSLRDDVFVFIDEAHRSVARELGTFLMAAVPRTTIVGFTGTPISATEQGRGTFKIFGTQDEKGYLDKYSIRESIEDETTLPIKHMLAPSHMTVPAEELDREFFELAGAEGVTDVEELNRVLDRAVGLRTFLKADDRVGQVAAFVADHFRENVLPQGYKAFLVAVDREACAKYKVALDRLLPPEWTRAIYTENAADVVDRPLVAELQMSPKEEEDARKLFRKADSDPRLLIVTDKLLTGYDARPLYCLYLDKPMRDHVLLQAIARVNRPYVDAEGVQKRVGLVVDFVGVLRELRKALRFDSSDVSGVIEDLDLLLRDFLGRIGRAAAEYLDAGGGHADERLERLVYGRFLDPEARRAFFEDYKEVEALWEILSPSRELVDHVGTFKRLAQLYATVRNAYAVRTGFVADLAHKTRRLVEASAVQEGLGLAAKVVTFDARTLETLRGGPGSDEEKVFNLVRGLAGEVNDDPDALPILRSLRDRANHVLDEIEKRNTTGAAALDSIAALAAERDAAEAAARETGLGSRAFGVFWMLRDNEVLKTKGIGPLDLARKVEAALEKYPNARASAEERRDFRAELHASLIVVEPNVRTTFIDRIIDDVLG